MLTGATWTPIPITLHVPLHSVNPAERRKTTGSLWAAFMRHNVRLRDGMSNKVSLLQKRGIPQGSSGSPLVCSMVTACKDGAMNTLMRAQVAEALKLDPS